MSGGAWGYLSHQLKETANGMRDVLMLLSVIEHELDWGACGDSCHACAKIRVIEALETFFASYPIAEDAIKVAKDRESYLCESCLDQRDRMKELAARVQRLNSVFEEGNVGKTCRFHPKGCPDLAGRWAEQNPTDIEG